MEWTSSQFRSNWSDPIFKSVLNSLNNSLYGVRYVKHVDEFEDIPSIHIISHAAQYGTVTALILIFIIENFLVKKESEKNKFILQWPLITNSSDLSTFTSFLIFFLLSPILITILLSFYIYKCVVKLILSIKYGSRFVSMMDGIDAVWAIEEDNAISVINVIAEVDLTMESDENKFFENFKSVVHSKLFETPSICPKMLYKKSFYSGYSYWTSSNDIKIEDYVKMVKFGAENELTIDQLEDFVSGISNSKLPHNNTATWEIFVSDKPVLNTNSFPILFRIHHSLGDGVALLKLLLNTIGCNKEREWRTKSLDENTDFFITLSNLFDIGNALKFVKIKLRQMLNGLSMCLIIPQTLLNQLLRPPDENVLHGPILHGRKLNTWLSEDECNATGLLMKIKHLKKRIPGVTFSELILMALSENFQKYFQTRNQTIPDFITSVVPVRMNPSDLYTMEYRKNKFILENKFSVAMLTIPVICDTKENHTSLLKRLIEVRKETDNLRRSADFYVNYGLMKLSGFILPRPILKPMMDSVQATLVISNLPGPSDVYICGKYRLEKMAFFVPHRGTTGIGLTILSCNDKLQFGIMADEALITNREDAKMILKGIVESLENLDQITSKIVKSQ